MPNQAENVAPIAKPKRAKSKETILKEKKRKVEKDLEVLEKKIEKFKEMKAEMVNAEEQQNQLKAELDSIKNELIKELGLE